MPWCYRVCEKGVHGQFRGGPVQKEAHFPRRRSAALAATLLRAARTAAGGGLRLPNPSLSSLEWLSVREESSSSASPAASSSSSSSPSSRSSSSVSSRSSSSEVSSSACSNAWTRNSELLELSEDLASGGVATQFASGSAAAGVSGVPQVSPVRRGDGLATSSNDHLPEEGLLCGDRLGGCRPFARLDRRWQRGRLGGSLALAEEGAVSLALLQLIPCSIQLTVRLSVTDGLAEWSRTVTVDWSTVVRLLAPRT